MKKRAKYECVDVYDPTTQRVESVTRPKRPAPKPSAAPSDAPELLMRRFAL